MDVGLLPGQNEEFFVREPRAFLVHGAHFQEPKVPAVSGMSVAVKLDILAETAILKNNSRDDRF
jgi:hypothetical protein